VHSPNVQFDPKADEVPRLAYRFRQASQVIALLVASLGLVVLGGWAFDVPTVTYIRPAFQSMKVNTALCFLFLGAGLWLAHDDKRQRSRRILGLAVAIIAGATLAEYAFHVSLGIDQLLFRDTRTPSLAAYPGRMAIATALCFLFLGLGVAFLGVRKAIVLQRALVAPCFALSLVALCGYLYGVQSLYSITAFSTMSLHTSAGLFAACLAYFLSRPDEGIVSIAASDSNSGFLLRTLVPAIIGVPILIGWLRLAGQRANLYDTPFGVALQVLGSIGCLAVLTMLVARSMYRWECENSHAGQMIRESEVRLRLATQAGRMYAYDWDVRTDVVVRSSEHVTILGRTEPLGAPPKQFVDKIHPDDRPKFLAAIARLTPENPTDDVTYRALASDGTLVWLRSNGRGFFDGEGKLLRVIGMVADVTDVKRAEEALAGMTRKLIEAQEQERARIGRELHDDINQRLAMLAVQVQQLQDDPSEVQNRAQELRKELGEISNDVQALSHELHSSKLQSLGVVAGIKSWCKEYAERQKIDIECRSDVSSILPMEIGICLFRVVQEALHNAIKHSGVKRVEVQLREESGEVHLLISDLGKGFDLEAAMRSKGLGLTSMRERIRLVNGTIAIESKPMHGTTVHVRVRLSSENDSQRAAG
jgi:signal transduction histidine kinase